MNWQYLLQDEESNPNFIIQKMVSVSKSAFASAAVFVHVWIVSMQALMAVISQAVMMIPGSSPGEEQSEQTGMLENKIVHRKERGRRNSGIE